MALWVPFDRSSECACCEQSLTCACMDAIPLSDPDPGILPVDRWIEVTVEVLTSALDPCFVGGDPFWEANMQGLLDDWTGALHGKSFLTRPVFLIDSACDCYLANCFAHPDTTIDIFTAFDAIRSPTCHTMYCQFASPGLIGDAICPYPNQFLNFALLDQTNPEDCVNLSMPNRILLNGPTPGPPFCGNPVMTAGDEAVIDSFECDPFELVFQHNFTLIGSWFAGYWAVGQGRIRLTCLEWTP